MQGCVVRGSDVNRWLLLNVGDGSERSDSMMSPRSVLSRKITAISNCYVELPCKTGIACG